MNGWFEFNGVRCTQYGIVVSELPAVSIAEERVEFKDVVGRNGSLAVLEGDDVYNDITMTCECWVKDMEQFDSAAQWLHGSGTVRFANRPEGTYRARITNQIDLDKIVRGSKYRKFTLNFRCKPFLYLDEQSEFELGQSNVLIKNRGNVYSEPEITVYPTDTTVAEDHITILAVGNCTMELIGLNSPMTIDTEMMEAYYGNNALNHKMIGDFPTFREGYTPVQWDGNVSKLVIRPRWRKR